jgi:hypothetical protein
MTAKDGGIFSDGSATVSVTKIVQNKITLY